MLCFWKKELLIYPVVLDKDIVLIGYSGHALVVADTALENNLNIIGYTEKVASILNPYNLNYLGNESVLDFKGWELDVNYLIGIGDNRIRTNVYNLIISKGKQVLSLINSRASISKQIKIGSGVFINRNVSINAFAKIGNNVILNTGCIVEHDCVVDDNVHIAPGAVLAGNVKIGTGSFIGANAIIKQGVVIGENVIVGAGTVVLSNVSSGKKVVGNPHRYISYE